MNSIMHHLFSMDKLDVPSKVNRLCIQAQSLESSWEMGGLIRIHGSLLTLRSKDTEESLPYSWPSQLTTKH